jgi:hypothetical protein
VKNVSKMMLVMWPNGIPTTDYDKAVALVSGMAKDKPRLSVVRPVESKNVERVKAALSTGPATAKEIADTLGLSIYAVKTALSKCATVSGSRVNASGFGIPANIYTLRKTA